MFSKFSFALVYLNTCQVTVQSFTGVCFGRLCYSGECDEFLSLMNTTSYQKIKNKIFSSIPWSSFTHSRQIKWPLWIDKNILILLLIVNLFLTLITLFIIIKSIRHAKILAERKSHRYSLF